MEVTFVCLGLAAAGVLLTWIGYCSGKRSVTPWYCECDDEDDSWSDSDVDLSDLDEITDLDLYDEE